MKKIVTNPETEVLVLTPAELREVFGFSVGELKERARTTYLLQYNGKEWVVVATEELQHVINE